MPKQQRPAGFKFACMNCDKKAEQSLTNRQTNDQGITTCKIEVFVCKPCCEIIFPHGVMKAQLSLRIELPDEPE